MLKKIIYTAIKNVKSSELGFILSAFSLLVINLSTATTMWGQIPIETNPQPININRQTLKTGSKGEEVLEIQGILKLLGYYFGEVDGIYSENTATAVMKFQESVGLMPNGIVDQNTWNLLLPKSPQSNNISQTTPKNRDSDCNCSATTNESSDKIDLETDNSMVDLPILKTGMRGNAVRALQKILKTKGFLQGKVDGIFGLQTQRAVKTAQRKYQQQQNGIVDNNLWIALLR
ncbi:MAG: peptidoglycan-binding protein [Trichodesmium sp.]